MKRNNINIGKDYWIIWKDADANDALDIDALLAPSWGFWLQLETQCVAECCGIHAFCFWPEEIKQAASKLELNRAGFLAEIAKLKEKIGASEFQSVFSQRLNDTVEKSVFIRLLAHIQHSLRGWVE